MEIAKFIRIQVKATERMKYLYYQVIGKGRILASHRVNPHGLKVFVFRFWATFAMVPEAVLVIYYYRPNGEIIAERATLRFDKSLNNYVSCNSARMEKFECEVLFYFRHFRPTSNCQPQKWNLEILSI
jgi:Alpha-2-macroglobulin bait region domain